MKTILLSFRPDVYERIYEGSKILEYRRTFPEGSVKAYMYVSCPVCSITGILYLSAREALTEWEKTYSCDEAVLKRINEYKKSVNYAMFIQEFHETNRITLEQLRRDIDNFVVPQMYYYLDGYAELKTYLEENISPSGYTVENKRDAVNQKTICMHQ